MITSNKLPAPLQSALVLAVLVTLVTLAQSYFMARDLLYLSNTGPSSLGLDIWVPLIARLAFLLLAVYSISSLIYRPVRYGARVALVLAAAVFCYLAIHALHWFTGTGTLSFAQTSIVGKIAYSAIRIATFCLLAWLVSSLRPYAAAGPNDSFKGNAS